MRHPRDTGSGPSFSRRTRASRHPARSRVKERSRIRSRRPGPRRAGAPGARAAAAASSSPSDSNRAGSSRRAWWCPRATPTTGRHALAASRRRPSASSTQPAPTARPGDRRGSSASAWRYASRRAVVPTQRAQRLAHHHPTQRVARHRAGRELGETERLLGVLAAERVDCEHGAVRPGERVGKDSTSPRALCTSTAKGSANQDGSRPKSGPIANTVAGLVAGEEHAREPRDARRSCRAGSRTRDGAASRTTSSRGSPRLRRARESASSRSDPARGNGTTSRPA